MTLKHDRLTIAQCDATNAAEVESVLGGHDAVFVTLGDKSRGPTRLYSTAARNVITAMARHNVRRLLFLSNFGVLDEKGRGFNQALLLFLVKSVIRHTLDDHRRALDAMRASQLEWTAVRAMPLTDKPATGQYRVVADGLPPGGAAISRADLAAFMLSEAERREFVHMTPAIAH